MISVDQRGNDVVEGAVHDLVKVVGLEAGAVIRQPVLGEVVGANAFGAIDCTNL